MTSQERIPLQIEKIVPRGLGLGFHEGRAVFVPFTAPGDRIVAEVTKRQSGSLFARCVEMVQPGAQRVEPACPLFTRCGGCQLRHLSGWSQRQIKGDFVRETLSRFPNLRDVEPLPTWAAAATEDGYRCRVGFKVRWVGSRLLLGFFQTASHHLVDLPDDCPVLERRLNRLIAPLRPLIGGLSLRQQLPQVDAVVGEEGVGMMFHFLAAPTEADREQLQRFAGEQGVVQLWVQQGRKSGMRPVVQRGALYYALEPYKVAFHPGDFTQAHQAGNLLLVQEAMRLGGSGAVAWDLFCGVGNFTLPLARQFAQVLGVEGYAPALQRAAVNAKQCQGGRIFFQAADLFQEQGIALLARQPMADLVLLDPPREGALLLVKWLLGRPPARVLYISCNPATFARDAAILVQGGFCLESVQPLDLFPHTAHLELIALFVRRR
ncbi:MAG: 23S rRNA (uracil(1939)-C(5))-methyltransferase RlmD [Magnetococcales bacterium]|nr:23S rRNA (uracil(1939)-C(5))-methyltransferase RlmD [Magnetococcales bacterium]